MTRESVPHSSHWGVFHAEVENGSVVGAVPAPDDPEPASFLRGVPDAVNARVRVRRPSVRASWLAGEGDRRPDLRGREAFVEVSWETAERLVADELRRVRERHGNTAIFGGSYGWSSAGRFHHAKSQLQRFLHCFGGFTGQVGNYSYAAASAIVPHVVGTGSPISGGVNSWDVIEEHTELWVMFGGVPLKNAQVESGGVSRHGARDRLRAIRASGTEFVSVTPMRDDAPEFLDAEWIAVRPNTDTAVMLGIAHTLLTERLHDESFLATHCVGWDRFEPYLRGVDDGVSKTAEWAAGVADIDPDALRTLARRMAAKRTHISVTWSLQRADHGEQPYWMAVVLAAMLGQIGLPGGGFGYGYGDAATIGNPRYPFPAPALPMGENPTGSAIPVARIVDMLLNPGAEYEFNGHTYTYPDTKLIYWAGGNPFHHHQDLNRMLQAWQRPETIIVHEPWWTATARHADIVLPATTTLERNDIGAASRDSAIVAMKQAVAPLHDARSDYDILRGIARRVAIEEQYTEGRDEMEWIRHLYDVARKQAGEHDHPLPEFDDFWDAGVVEIPRGSFVLFDSFRANPVANALRTPSGRIEIFSQTIDSFGYDDCPGHPVWLEPTEWLGSDRTRRWPLHLISNQPHSRLHSQLDMAAPSRESKIAGREPCRLNPLDAAARDISDGDVVRILNDRGSCLAGAVISSDVRRGVVQLATGAWYQPLAPDTAGSLEVHGNPNVLTPDHGTSRLGQGPSAHTALVEVERYVEEPPPVTVLTDPPSGTR